MKAMLISNPAIGDQKILILPTSRGIEIIDTATVIRIEAISNYSKIYFTDRKTLVVSKVLKWFETALPAGKFIRVHRTHMVNKLFIHQCIKTESCKVGLINGELVEVSRRKKASVIQDLHGLAA